MTDTPGAERPTAVRTKRECFDAVVREMNLDTRDPFTLLFAHASALVDQRDQYKQEIDRMREAGFPYSDALGFARQARETIGQHVQAVQQLQDEKRELARQRDALAEQLKAADIVLAQDAAKINALEERVKEAKRGEIAWQDGNIPELIHSATVEQTRSIMKAYFDEWPDGLDEIESSINQFKQRAELAESRLASLTEELKRLTGLNWPDSKQVATVTLPSGDKWATCPAIAEHIASLTEAAKRLAEAPKVVCLCGSSRFWREYQQAEYDLTMAGHIYLSIGFYPHAAPEMHGEGVGHTAEQKVALDELHKRKIDLADEVLVLNIGGYIGESTRSEIEYAKAHGKPVRYIEQGDAACREIDAARGGKPA